MMNLLLCVGGCKCGCGRVGGSVLRGVCVCVCERQDVLHCDAMATTLERELLRACGWVGRWVGACVSAWVYRWPVGGSVRVDGGGDGYGCAK